MMNERGQALYKAGCEGRLLALIRETIPREEWAADPNLLIYAALGPNLDAIQALISAVPPGHHNLRGPMEAAIAYDQPEVLEVFCALGGLSHHIIANDRPLIHIALRKSLRCSHVLIANGTRVYDEELTVFFFQKGVLGCRRAVCALLCAKDACRLWRWDRFLLAEIALAVWSTRSSFLQSD